MLELRRREPPGLSILRRMWPAARRRRTSPAGTRSSLLHAEAPRREDLTSRGALEGERKQVTVLFADLKGSMDLSESIDPEDWHRIMDRFFAILADGVHRFEGTVNQYTGDGIMALFGAPIAHEDHAQRACYAALHLKDELRRYSDELRLARGLNFSVRIGLNSGEVVVGRIGDDLLACRSGASVPEASSSEAQTNTTKGCSLICPPQCKGNLYN
jgi:class 3 adenylate cyclase